MPGRDAQACINQCPWRQLPPRRAHVFLRSHPIMFYWPFYTVQIALPCDVFVNCGAQGAITVVSAVSFRSATLKFE
jgi:hypothetical protein